MPPSKGAPLKQKALPFKAAKYARTKGGKGPRATCILTGNRKSDEALLKLRIPLSLCKMLPSVKKYNGLKRSVNRHMVQSPVEESEDVKPLPSQLLLGIKRKRGENTKYHLRLIHEEKFTGMIFDVSFGFDDSVIVSTSEGAYLCDNKFENRRKLDNINFAGGITRLNEAERFAIVCRFADTVSIFEKDGTFVRSFSAGFSPMGIVATSNNQLVVTDSGDKCLHVYTLDGEMVHEVPTKNTGYEFKWPLYLAKNSLEEILVTDCHQQEVFVFNSEFAFQKSFPLKTYGGNQVLRPHGVCVLNDDIFVIDEAIDSMEVFVSAGNYLQTLLPSEQGVAVKPKVMQVSPHGTHMVIGGMTGVVEVFEFVGPPVAVKEEHSPNTKASLLNVSIKKEKKANGETYVCVKKEPKEEVITLD